MVSDQKNAAKVKRRILPRVSKATGGPNPGFEFIRLSDIDAIDDAEYVERMKRGFK